MQRLDDELSWELVRDEWELLIHVGTGPTSAEAVAEALGEPIAAVRERLELLAEHGIVEPLGESGWTLRPVTHTRREGMASYLRDLVLGRLAIGGPAPLVARVRDGLGGAEAMRALLTQADTSLLPGVVELASAPEPQDAERYTVLVALASHVPPDPEATPGARRELLPELLRVLRAAALERSDPATADGAKLWVAEMRTGADTAQAVGAALERFADAPSKRGGLGALAVIVLPTATG